MLRTQCVLAFLALSVSLAHSLTWGKYLFMSLLLNAGGAGVPTPEPNYETGTFGPPLGYRTRERSPMWRELQILLLRQGISRMPNVDPITA